MLNESASAGPTRRLSPEILRRSVFSLGDGALLRRVLAAARDGRPTTIGVIGGSITQGASASAAATRYADQLAAWFAGRFPQSSVRLVNAGLGATGSNYAALRARRDLLEQQPDLVVLEFAVNDGVELQFGESFEGLLRQIRRQPNSPAVLALFMMHRGGRNAQVRLGAVTAHYGVPSASYRDALQHEIDAGRMAWEDISPDEVHPNDFGHGCAAQFLIHLVESVEAGAPNANPLIPTPLYTDAFERTALFEAPAARPIGCTGWSLDVFAGPGASWRTDRPGSQITFEIAGNTILLMYYRIRGNAGIVSAQVDDLPPKELDAWFPGTWGGYRETIRLAGELPPGAHRVTLTLTDRRHAESEGHEFRLLGLGAAGVQH